MNKLIIHRFLILLFFFWMACTPKRQYTSKPSKSLINSDSELLEVNSVAYHLNDSMSRIYLEIKNENLLYKRPDSTKSFYSELKIVYRVLPDYQSKVILDSGSYYMKDRSEDESIKSKSLYSQFNIKALGGRNWYLDLEVMDINRKIKYSHGLILLKTSRYSAQNFLLSVRDTIVFTNHFVKNEEVMVRFSNSEINRVLVNCFFNEQGPALPPFSSKVSDGNETTGTTLKIDSVYTLSLNTNQFLLKMPEKGFYHVIADSKGDEGLTLFTYDENFPGVASSDDMISCTRYIMSKEEFETCKSAEDQKECIDRFWLNIAGSNERARELLKRYYGRVKEANKKYTSYTQGWKTDRGMVYIIFGPPVNIYRSKKDEIWAYGNEANPNSLRFVFNKKMNPYSDNHFVMERSQFYKDNWYTAVEMWRQGLIYSESNK